MIRFHAVVGVCLVGCIDAASALSAQQASAASDSSSFEADNGLLVYEASDGRSRLWLDGRVVLQAATFMKDDNDLPTGVELRRARFAAKGVFGTDWAGELDLELSDGEVEVMDAWLAYAGWDQTAITIGNQKVPNGLEQLGTSKWTTFIERSLADALVSDRRIGLTARRWGRGWQATVGLFGEDPGNGAEDGEKEGTGWAARLTTNPRLDEGRFVHLGASASSFTPDEGSERVRFRQRPGVHIAERLLNTGQIDEVDRQFLIAGEAAAHLGAVTLQAEAYRTRVRRLDDAVNSSLFGWYGTLSWMLNGGRRTYFQDTGEFGYPVHHAGREIWEVAIRYSQLSLNDPQAGLEGGKGSTGTIGLNWYPNRHVRFAANLVWVEHDTFADADGDLIGDDDFILFATSAQVVF